MVFTKKIRVAVIDDHALFRAGLISLLAQTPGIEIVGEGGSGKDAVYIVRDTQPDVVLLDVNMPLMNGVEAVKEIKRFSNTRILMLTISKQQVDLIGAIRAGADGYILKNMEPKELYNAIKLAAEGKSVLSPEITEKVFQVVRKTQTIDMVSHELTPREYEVLILLSKGKTNPQISEELHISENTVKTHVRNLMDKLGASTRTEAVSIAIQDGILNSSKDS